MNLAFSVVVAYFVFITAMGVYFAKYVNNTDDFMVASRSLPGYVVAGTLIATSMGGGTVVGGANSLAFSNSFIVALVWGAALPLAVLSLYCIADKLRLMNFFTVPQIVEKRYGKMGGVLAGVIMVLSYLGITAYQFKSVGFVLNVTLGIPVATGTLIGLFLITVTAVFGGLFSVAYTDCASALLMLLGIGLGIPAAIYKAGGWGVIAAQLPVGHMTTLGSTTPLQCFSFFFSFFLLAIGDQAYYQRFFAAKDKKAVRNGVLFWCAATAFIMPMVALGSSVARALYPTTEPGQALMQLAGKGMPALLGAITIATIAAFVITTGNSYLLSCGVNLTWDIFSKFFSFENVSDKQRLTICRCSVLGLAGIGYALITFAPNVLAVQMYAYTMYGAALTPALLAAILWKKATPIAGVGSMLVGGVCVLAWELLSKPFGIASVVISAPLAIITLVALGNLTYKGEPNPFDLPSSQELGA